MTDIKLSKAATAILTTGASHQDGPIILPETMKPSTRERTIGRLLRDGLVVASPDGLGHRLTPAAYRALGIEMPAGRRGPEQGDEGARRGGKQALVLDLLGRPEGASLGELTHATGWLPHTARAALSRLRSAGKKLAKSKREDGTTTYCIVVEEPAPVRKRGRRGSGQQVEATA